MDVIKPPTIVPLDAGVDVVVAPNLIGVDLSGRVMKCYFGTNSAKTPVLGFVNGDKFVLRLVSGMDVLGIYNIIRANDDMTVNGVVGGVLKNGLKMYSQIQFRDSQTGDIMTFDRIEDKRMKDEVYRIVMEAIGWRFDPLTGARTHILDVRSRYEDIFNRISVVLKTVESQAL
jgi:hypothetical protein